MSSNQEGNTAARPWSAVAGTGWLAAAVLLGLFWLLIFNQQRLEWTVNAVYAYGWAIPFLALYLLWERWKTRPAPGEPITRAQLLAASALLLAAYLPVRVIQEANPDWVKINWLMAALCSGLTLLAVAAVGGWRYVVHFGFPILFCFCALPWPVWMENAIMQNLMRVNASVCAELLTFGGYPALASGNLIQVGDHVLNVAEACSGIRSLQTAFMMSLFLGEFYRMTVVRRLVLMVSAFVVAFAVNLGRTIVLSIAVAKGHDADKWHDPVGTVAMILCLVALCVLAEVIRRGQRAGEQVAVEKTPPSFVRLFPGWFAVLGCVWLVGSEGLTHLWYTVHERSVPPAMAWHVAWPETAPRFQNGKLGEQSLALLKYDQGATASWVVNAAYGWQMYALSWSPGRVSKFLSSAHYPTVCLPATGMQLDANLGIWECKINGLNIPFYTYLFNEGGREVYVFHAIIEDRPARVGTMPSYRQVDSSERLESVWHGERNLGQHVIGIALTGALSSEEARIVVEHELKSVIQPDATPPTSLSAL